MKKGSLYALTIPIRRIGLSIFLWLSGLTPATAQQLQTAADIRFCREMRIKAVTIASISYDDNALVPEGQVLTRDSMNEVRHYDTSGRLIREYSGAGTRYRREIGYDAEGRASDEVWYYSRKSLYPGFIQPVHDSDYDGVYKKIRHYYGAAGRLDSSLEGNGTKTVYQYDEKGLLLTVFETLASGHLRSFRILKYGTGVLAEKIVYEVSNTYTYTNSYEYKYEGAQLVEKTGSLTDGKKSITRYNTKGQETTIEIYNAGKQLVARFEYQYQPFGPALIRSYRLPYSNSQQQNEARRLRISEELIYFYETYQ